MNIYVACAEHDKSRPHGWRMAIDCVFLGGAEHDKSCPHGWRLAIDCVFLGGAEHDESCPYGSRPALLNLSVFCEFYLYHLQLSKKMFIFTAKSYMIVMLCSLSR